MSTDDQRRADTVRTVALAAAAAAVITVPTLGPVVLKTREDTERYDTAITPPDYAFAVWAPIFTGIAATAVQAGLGRRRSLPENRDIGAPLTAAYALNAVWSIAAQSGRFGYTVGLLPAAVVAAGTAYRHLQRQPTDQESIASVSTGLLLGWTSLAATVNVSAGTQLLGADPRSARSVTFSTAAAILAAGAIGAVVGRSRRGYVPLAVTATWGLITTAFDRRRPPLVRAGVGLGATLVVGAVAARARRPRGGQETPGAPTKTVA